MYLFCDKYVIFYVDKSYIHIWNNYCETFNVAKSFFCLFAYIAMFLLTVYHHMDGFVHDYLNLKQVSILTNWIGP